MYIVLTSQEVITNWKNIKNDPYNNNPDIDNPYEYIHKAKRGLVSAGGIRVIVSDRVPELE